MSKSDSCSGNGDLSVIFRIFVEVIDSVIIIEVSSDDSGDGTSTSSRSSEQFSREKGRHSWESWECVRKCSWYRLVSLLTIDEVQREVGEGLFASGNNVVDMRRVGGIDELELIVLQLQPNDSQA